MSEDNSWTSKAAMAGAAIGSAALAAAVMYASRRMERAKKKDRPAASVPSGENPETD
ncbi:isopropylmalate isomerase [Croceicoccus marinus]|jgi:Na+/H+-translocating membrane pyrophosphatase|uniref:Isopropylmalate isomerase n=1 Tax=Croceicoccus marinus TaxID=450378 RepID=A0A7G6VSC1_9SPHN|nr:isopropylmalate isomerase [Croceicoccus marinus]QNE04636.1 isopropylmalate isomerase [Croceicoccus marinus]